MNDTRKNRCTRAMAWGGVGLALVTFAATAHAEAPARALTPPAFPTDVYITLFDLEVFEIDEQQETFLIEADLGAEWYDPRLAFGAETDQPSPPAVFEQEAATDFLKTIWWPNFELLDGRDSRSQMHLSIEVYPDGTVTYHERFSAVIKQQLDLRPFPFDVQEISFVVGPFSASPAAVNFLPMEENQQLVQWEPSEWVIELAELAVSPGVGCSGSGEICSDDADCAAGETCDYGWATLAVNMVISRVPTHYVWKIILPLTLIVLASSAVFWLDLVKFPDPGDRLTLSFTGVLTIVAFDFVSADSMPKTFYASTLDKILMMAYVFMAINIALNVASTIFSTDRPDTSRKVDLIGRWVFPGAFLFGLLVLRIAA